MIFERSSRAAELHAKLQAFMNEHVYPGEKAFAEQHRAQADPWEIPPILEELKDRARAQGL